MQKKMSLIEQPAVLLIAIAMVAFLVVKTRLISKFLDIICSSNPYKKWFANLMKKITQKNSEISKESPVLNLKRKLFSQIEDKVKEIGGDVLEIGAGAGSSLDFLCLPEKSSLVVVDYNPHMEKYFREKLAQTPHIKLKDYLVQSATDMSNIPDNSFAAVFVIDVMCSVEEKPLRMMLKEMKRVLKPDGCLFFMEHILDAPGTLRRVIQKFISSWTRIWPILFDGCRCDKETWKFIQETGFSRVTLTYTYLPSLKTESLPTKIFYFCFLYLIKRFLTGNAKK